MMLETLRLAIETHQQPIVLFGAATLGEVALRTLEADGVRPACFCDNSPLKQGKQFFGYDVISPAALKRDFADPYVIVCSIRYGGICDQLCSLNIFPHDSAEIFACVNYQFPYSEPAETVKAEIARYLGIIAVAGASDRLYIENVDLAITEKCSLHCRDCMNLATYYPAPRDIDTDLLLQSFGRLADCTDGVFVVNVHGGEPFMNKNMHLVVDYLVKNPKVMKIMVITNGTLVPLRENLTCLKNDKVCVALDDYGELSRKIPELQEAFIREGINHKLMQVDEWLDYGGFECRNRSKEELLDTFDKCRKCFTVLNGKLFVCGRAAHGINLGIFAHSERDYVDLITDKLTNAELRREVYGFLHRTENLAACNYCNGFNLECATMIKSAIQK